MRKRNAIAAVLLAGTLCFSAVPAHAFADDTTSKQEKIANTYSYATLDVSDGSWIRKGGYNRYETMELVVQATFDQSDYAILATGDRFTDALCANALAGTLKCPVLLTATSGLTDQTKSELERLGVKNLYIVGNTSAISTAIEEEFKMRGYNVTRLAGGTDQETSIKVMQECRKAGTPSENVIIATGTKFPDALSIGPWAYASGSPILFTDASGMLSDAQASALKADGKFKHAVVVGGATAVSDKVADQLGSGIEGWRIGGADRYDTSAKVADWCVTHGGLTYSAPVLTTAKNFPDALCGAALAAKNKSVLIVADAYSDVTVERLQKNANLVKGGFILGGKTAMPIDNPLVDPTQKAEAAKMTEAINEAPTGGVTSEDGSTIDDSSYEDSSEEDSSEEVESFR